MKYKEYSALKNIHYKGTGIQGFTTGAATLLQAGSLFSDYLQHNIISLMYSNMFLYDNFGKGLQAGGLNYQNRVYPLEWSIGYEVIYKPSQFKTDSSVFGEQFKESVSFEHTGYSQFHYPLFKKGHWFSSISSLKLLDFLDYSATKGLWRDRLI